MTQCLISIKLTLKGSNREALSVTCLRKINVNRFDSVRRMKRELEYTDGTDDDNLD